MRSRKDQVQAHAYMVGRLTSALVHAEPDAPESPLRRTGLGSFGGLLIGTLAVAGFLIWGLISPASGGTLTAGELVMVRATGARFIYADSQLRPVLNWSSALLLMGGNAAMTPMSSQQLAGIPVGPPLGILGAPDALPPAGSVNTGNWLACASSASGQPLVSLSIGVRVAVTALPLGSAVIVQAPVGLYLLWGGHRLRVDAPWILRALGLGRARVIDVDPAWLNAVPAGPDLAPMSLAGVGGPGPTLGALHTLVGQVLVEHNVGSPGQFYLVDAGGVTPISSTQAALVLADGNFGAAYGGATPAPIQVSPVAIVNAPVARPRLADGAGAPPAPPAGDAPGGGSAVCMDYAGVGGTAPRIVFARPPPGRPPALGMLAVTASPEGAGLISVVPGGGALVRPQAAPGVGGNSLFLVTDTGVKFPVPSASAAQALGYLPGAAAALPAALVGLLPTGPALDLAPLRG